MVACDSTNITTSTTQTEQQMSIDILAKQSLEAAMSITGTDGKDEHTQEIAFMLACAMAAECSKDAK